MLKLIKEFAYLLMYVCAFIRNKCFITKILSNKHGSVIVLANGPSLKDDLELLMNENYFNNIDCIVLNFFAFDEAFFIIKPRHYCLVDPMYFKNSSKIEQVRALYNLFQNRVDWDFNLYIPSNQIHQFHQFSCITNPCISIVKVNMISYNGSAVLRNVFYKFGFAIPPVQSVVIMSIYIALNMGYTEIELFGVDHSFFDSLCVNKDNQLCSKDVHFYDENKSSLKPFYRTDSNEIWKISDYVDAISKMFKSHDLLSSYSKYLGVNIYNNTKNSMIDSYIRKNRLE